VVAKPKPGPGKTLAVVVSGLLLVLCTGACGATLGGLYVRLFVPRTGMGWDQLADTLGGLMLGGLIGLVAGGVLAAILDTRRRWLAAAAFLAVAVVVATGFVLTREPRATSQQVLREGIHRLQASSSRTEYSGLTSRR
jgi:hypothetical protein